MTVSDKQQCPECGGIGLVPEIYIGSDGLPDEDGVKCPACNGTWEVPQEPDQHQMSNNAPEEPLRCECGACYWDADLGAWSWRGRVPTDELQHCPGECGCRLSVENGEPRVEQSYATISDALADIETSSLAAAVQDAACMRDQRDALTVNMQALYEAIDGTRSALRAKADALDELAGMKRDGLDPKGDGAFAWGQQCAYRDAADALDDMQPSPGPSREKLLNALVLAANILIEKGECPRCHDGQWQCPRDAPVTPLATGECDLLGDEAASCWIVYLVAQMRWHITYDQARALLAEMG